MESRIIPKNIAIILHHINERVSSLYKSCYINGQIRYELPDGQYFSVYPLIWDAFVVEFADNYEEAEKNRFEDGNLFYIEDYPDEEKLIEAILNEIEAETTMETPRQVLVWEILEGKIPDEIGITAEEYYNAGWEYECGLYGFQDIDLAIKAYELAASKGYTRAFADLGRLYKRKKQDLETAYKWYLEASLCDENGEALFEIALMYHEGDYLRQNQERALQLFRLSYEKGCEKSIYYLGLYYEQGIAVETDPEKALVFYQEGSDKYQPECRKAVMRLKREGFEHR